MNNFFSFDNQLALILTAIIVGGIGILASRIFRWRVKNRLNSSIKILLDIPNENYTDAVSNIPENYIERKEIRGVFNRISKIYDVSNEDYNKALSFINSSISYNRVSGKSLMKTQKAIAEFKDSNGGITIAKVDGKTVRVRNTADLGDENKIIFVKRDKDVLFYQSNNITDWQVIKEKKVENSVNTDMHIRFAKEDIAMQKKVEYLNKPRNYRILNIINHVRTLQVKAIAGISILIGIASGYIDSKTERVYFGEKISGSEVVNIIKDGQGTYIHSESTFNFLTASVLCLTILGLLLTIQRKSE